MSQALQWCWPELRRLKQGTQLLTQYGKGRLERVRESDIVVKLDHGATAYLSRSGIAEPPSRLPKGALVYTPVGEGVVEAARFSDDGCSYVVRLSSWILANGASPVGYFDLTDVMERQLFTMDEAVYESQVLRQVGNGHIRSGSLEAALVSYEDCDRVLDKLLPKSRNRASDEQQRRYTVARAAAAGNLSEVLRRLNRPQEAMRQAQRCLRVDPKNLADQRAKATFRLGVAAIKAKEYAVAVTVLNSPLLADHAKAKSQARIAERRLEAQRAAELKQDKTLARKMFGRKARSAASLKPAAAQPAAADPAAAAPPAVQERSGAAAKPAAAPASGSSLTPTKAAKEPAANVPEELVEQGSRGPAEAAAEVAPVASSQPNQAAAKPGQPATADRSIGGPPAAGGVAASSSWLLPGALAAGALLLGALAAQRLWRR